MIPVFFSNMLIIQRKIIECCRSNRLNFDFRFHLHKSLEMWGFHYVFRLISSKRQDVCFHSEPMMRFSVGFDEFVIRSEIEMHFGGWDIIVVRFQLAIIMARRQTRFRLRRRLRYINVLLIKYLNRDTSMKCGTLCSLIFGFFLILIWIDIRIKLKSKRSHSIVIQW